MSPPQAELATESAQNLGKGENTQQKKGIHLEHTRKGSACFHIDMEGALEMLPGGADRHEHGVAFHQEQ